MKEADMPIEESITNIEVKLSFTEDLVEELNQTVYKQQQQIDMLQKEVKALKLQMASNMPSDGNHHFQRSQTTSMLPLLWLSIKCPS
jgi:SlyX protein